MRIFLLLLLAFAITSCGSRDADATIENAPEEVEELSLLEQLDWANLVDSTCHIGDSIFIPRKPIEISLSDSTIFGTITLDVYDNKVVGFHGAIDSEEHYRALFDELTAWYNEMYSGNEQDAGWNYWRFKSQDGEPSELTLILSEDEFVLQILSSQLTSI